MNIEEEIDKLVNKFSEDLKLKLTKIVIKHEKHILKQHVSSTKNSSTPQSSRRGTSDRGKMSKAIVPSHKGSGVKQYNSARTSTKQTYPSDSDDYTSDSE
jgi:hypothetical protein